MKSFSEFFNEGIVYSHSDSHEKFKPSTPISQWDPHKHYDKHVGNLMHLKFIQRHSKDAREKAQATKEIDTAHRKIKFWSNHPKFDQKKGAEIVKKHRNQWTVK